MALKANGFRLYAVKLGGIWTISTSSCTCRTSPKSVSGKNGRRFEQFAEVCQDFPNRPQLRDERNQSNIAAAVQAVERKLLPDSGHEFRPRNPGGVVGAGLLAYPGAPAVVAPSPRAVLRTQTATGRRRH